MFKLINKMKNKKGFTLVELIIVLAVLVIIAAIAVPRFANVQKESRIKADVSTAKSLVKTVEMAIANEHITLVSSTITININTSLVQNGYLDSIPSPQHNTSGSFHITVTSAGAITVYDDSSSGEEIYPSPGSTYDI